MCESCAPRGSKQLEMGPWSLSSGEGETCCPRPRSVRSWPVRLGPTRPAVCAPEPMVAAGTFGQGVSRKAETCVLVQHLASTCQDLEAKL